MQNLTVRATRKLEILSYQADTAEGDQAILRAFFACLDDWEKRVPDFTATRVIKWVKQAEKDLVPLIISSLRKLSLPVQSKLLVIKMLGEKDPDFVAENLGSIPIYPRERREIAKDLPKDLVKQHLRTYGLQRRHEREFDPSLPSPQKCRKVVTGTTRILSTRIAKGEELKYLITEHRRRTADYLFYVLAYVFHTEYEYDLAPTWIQYGKGSKKARTNACHSAITPSLRRRTKGGDWEEHCLKDFHFGHAINATVELPRDVNEFDSLVEEQLRPVAIAVINMVARGEMDPREGMMEFLGMADQVFAGLSKVNPAYAKLQRQGLMSVLADDLEGLDEGYVKAHTALYSTPKTKADIQMKGAAAVTPKRLFRGIAVSVGANKENIGQ